MILDWWDPSASWSIRFPRSTTRRVWNSSHSSKLRLIPFGQGILQIRLRVGSTQNCHALSTSPNTHGMVGHMLWLILSSRLFTSLLLLKKQSNSICCMVLRPTFLTSFCSQHRRWYSQIYWVIMSSLKYSSCRLKINNVLGILKFSRVFRGIRTSRLGFLELEVRRAWWGTKIALWRWSFIPFRHISVFSHVELDPPYLQTRKPCVYVTRMRSVRSTQWARCAQKMCVQQVSASTESKTLPEAPPTLKFNIRRWKRHFAFWA